MGVGHFLLPPGSDTKAYTPPRPSPFAVAHGRPRTEPSLTMTARPVMTTSSLDLERLRRLPAGRDVWQLAVGFGPHWIVPNESDGEPELPLIAICRSKARDTLGMGAPGLPGQSGDPIAPLAFGAMSDLAGEPGCGARPAVVEVTDPALHAELVAPLAGIGITVELVEQAVELDEVVAAMRAELGGPMATLLAFAPAVPLERIASFAEAAVAFHDAAPWNQLCDLDLVYVESPGAPADMRWFVVLGAMGLELGMGFFHDMADFEALQEAPDGPPSEAWARKARWSFTLDPPQDLPLTQYELWQRHRLPRTDEGRFPLLLALGGKGLPRPVDEARLDFTEALLRAIIATTEDELDSGRWSKRVRVAGREQTITLSLPTLLAEETLPGLSRVKPRRNAPLDRRVMEREMAKIGRMISEQGMSIAEVNARIASSRGKPLAELPRIDPREQAQDLCYDALEVEGRLRIKRARQALRLWPDCADALLLLGEEMPDPARARAFFEQALAAGARALGPEAFVEYRGRFWGVFEMRPYMRARAAVAGALWAEGEIDQAIEHWFALLELDAEDHQGTREMLIPRLLERGRDEDAQMLIARFREHASAVVRYAEALVTFRMQGKGAESTAALAAAVRANAHAVKHLLDPEFVPGELPASFRFGGEAEGRIVALSLQQTWQATPGAEDWLREHRREAKKAREKARKGRR